MTTVYTKAQLKSAIEQKQFPIKCKGEIAERLKKRKKLAKSAKIGGAALVFGGLLAMPFTGGTSVAAIGTGLGLTIGSGWLVISTAELAILVGGGVAITGILKGRKVKLMPDGAVTID